MKNKSKSMLFMIIAIVSVSATVAHGLFGRSYYSSPYYGGVSPYWGGWGYRPSTAESVVGGIASVVGAATSGRRHRRGWGRRFRRRRGWRHRR